VNLSLSRSDEITALPWLDDAADTLESICESLDPEDATVGVVIVDDPFIRDINRRFRDRDLATDVISFSYLGDDDVGADDLVGEVYVSHDSVAREAEEAGVAVAHMFLRVAVHGLLHVLGHDHGSSAAATRMQRREREILCAHLGPEPADALF
jgi:rRNA maturation RNase YbeY